MNKKSKKKPLMYIGPTIPGVITTGTIFNNGVSKAFAEKEKECHSLSELLTPIDQVSEKLKEIQQGKGATSVFFNNVRIYLTKEV